MGKREILHQQKKIGEMNKNCDQVKEMYLKNKIESAQKNKFKQQGKLH